VCYKLMPGFDAVVGQGKWPKETAGGGRNYAKLRRVFEIQRMLMCDYPQQASSFHKSCGSCFYTKGKFAEICQRAGEVTGLEYS
jgi:hypothetical protein